MLAWSGKSNVIAATSLKMVLNGHGQKSVMIGVLVIQIKFVAEAMFLRHG